MVVQSLNIHDILDFSWCPLYYDLKRKTKEEKNIKQAYDEALHHCFYAYLRALQNGYIHNTMGLLKNEWGKQWIKKKKNSEIALTPSSLKRDSYEQKRKSGIDAIITFEKLMQEEQFPIAIDLPYELRLPHNIIVTGVWEYIREVNGELQILKFRTEDNKFQTNHWANHDMELTAAELAFNQVFSKKHPRLIYVDIYGKKLMSTIRTEQDYKTFYQTVYSVNQCIQHNIRCVTPDKRCYHCEYRNQCMK